MRERGRLIIIFYSSIFGIMGGPVGGASGVGFWRGPVDERGEADHATTGR